MEGRLTEAVGDGNDTDPGFDGMILPVYMAEGVRDKLVRPTRVCTKCVAYWYRFFMVYVRAFDNQVLAPVCVL